MIALGVLLSLLYKEEEFGCLVAGIIMENFLAGWEAAKMLPFAGCYRI